jgi:very-short-patch-repair endonuclease
MSLSRSPKIRLVAVETARHLRRTETKAEKILWSRLRNRKLNGRKFLRQHPILAEFQDKETFFVADFYCSEEQLVVELDGGIHAARVKHDRARENVLKRLGYRVIRIRNREIETACDAAIERIAAMFSTRSSSRDPRITTKMRSMTNGT